jgi:PAB1-binding protein PBP1
LSKYPLPPKEMQPPNVPLLDPHPMSNVYDVGLYVSKEHSESICRTFTLLPHGESGRYKLADNNYAFAKDADQGANPTWYTMETRVPFVHLSRAKSDQETEEWAGPAIIRPSSSSPLFSVQHEVSLSLTFTYDLDGSEEKAQERLNFRVPLSFGLYLPVSRSVPASPSGGVARDLPLALPSYSQLYDSNGERKIDYSIPLPRYTPKDVTPPSQQELELEASVSASEKPESHIDVSEDEPLLGSS